MIYALPPVIDLLNRLYFCVNFKLYIGVIHIFPLTFLVFSAYILYSLSPFLNPCLS